MIYHLQSAAASIHFCDPKRWRQWQLQAWTLESDRPGLELGSAFTWCVTTARVYFLICNSGVIEVFPAFHREGIAEFLKVIYAQHVVKAQKILAISVRNTCRGS